MHTSHPPASRPIVRSACRIIAYNVPFATFGICLFAYLNTNLHTLILASFFLLVTISAGVFDAFINRSFPSQATAQDSMPTWKHTLIFTLGMLLAAPIVGGVIVLFVFFIWTSGIH